MVFLNSANSGTALNAATYVTYERRNI